MFQLFFVKFLCRGPLALPRKHHEEAGLTRFPQRKERKCNEYWLFFCRLFSFTQDTIHFHNVDTYTQSMKEEILQRHRKVIYKIVCNIDVTRQKAQTDWENLVASICHVAPNQPLSYWRQIHEFVVHFRRSNHHHHHHHVHDCSIHHTIDTSHRRSACRFFVENKTKRNILGKEFVYNYIRSINNVKISIVWWWL